MASVYPEELSHRVRNDPKRAAEVKTYDSLQHQLSNQWSVFYSVSWLGRTSVEGSPHDGETDFIVAHPEHGILLIEVKGGRIGYIGSKRQWVSTDRYGNDYDIDPFMQVVQSKHALLHKIKSLPGWSNRWINLGHAVAFPDCAVSKTALLPEAPIEIIIDGDNMEHLTERIVFIMQYWKGKEPQPSFFGKELALDLQKLLAPTTTLPNPLRLQLKDEEKEILRLTEEQFRLLNWLKHTRRAAISGCAGAGKTMLAVEKAKRLAQEGFRTLLTCYNNPLAGHLLEIAGKVDNLTISTFHQLCYRMAREANIHLPAGTGSNQQHIFNEDFPDALSQAIVLRPDLKYDAIIVDEGQDFQDTWWLALEECLQEGQNSIFYVFYDDNQRIYPNRGGIPSDLQFFPLTENVRNTRTIHRALVTYYQGDSTAQSRGPVGRSIEIHSCSTTSDLRKLLQHVLYKLIVIEQLTASDIVVLTPKALTRSALSSLRLDGNFKLVEKPSGQQHEILYSTVYSFKGLERAVVIIVELEDEVFSTEMARDALCYVAFSRPRSHLILLGQQHCIVDRLPKEQ